MKLFRRPQNSLPADTVARLNQAPPLSKHAGVSGYTTAYEGAGQGPRVRSWQPSTSGVNRDLTHEGAALRSRSRDLARNNSAAEGAIEAMVDNIVGTGMRPLPTVDRTNTALKQQVLKLWKRWVPYACSDGALDLYGLQALACRCAIQDGESFVRRRRRRLSDNLPVPLQLQILDADMLDLRETGTIPRAVVIGGIVFNRTGQRIGYRFYRDHPGEHSGNYAEARSLEKVGVRADDVAHLFMPKRAGQVRGNPWLSQVIIKLKTLDNYDDFELKRKETQSMLAAFITSEPDGTGSQIGAQTQQEPDEHGGADLTMEAGAICALSPGEKIDFSPPSGVDNGFEGFMRHHLRGVASGIGVAYHQLSGDLTQVNYSSIRAGLMDTRRRAERLQEQLIKHQLCLPIWRWFLDAALESGKLVVEDQEQRDALYFDTSWMPQAWEWVDPLKDISAIKMRLRAGLISRSQAAAMLGIDIETLDQEIAEDNRRADELGLVFDSDGRPDPVAEAAENGNDTDEEAQDDE